MKKFLVILTGNARGGEITWNTLYNKVLIPNNADLALLFGKDYKKSESLYSEAKYIWEVIRI